MDNLTTVIVVAVLLVLLGYGVVIYNSLVYLRENMRKAWSNIDIILKQRHDELPKLVETCKQHMEFEKETLERVMAARSGANIAREKSDVKGIGAAEGMLRGALGNITATIEAYPTLKADQSIANLMGRVTGLENAISDRREFYNDAVNINNVRLDTFPDVIVARLFTFKPGTLLEFTEEEKKDPDFRQLFRT